MDFIAVIILLGIVQGFFLGTLLLFSKGPNRRANRFLGALFICYSLSIIHFFLLRANLYEEFPHLQRIGLPVLFLFGPLFYFYVKVLTDRAVVLRSRDLLHGVPSLLLVLAMLPFYIEGREAKIAEIAKIRQFSVGFEYLLASSLQVLQLFIYLYLVRKILDQYNQKIRKTKSSLELINLRWLWMGSTLYFVVFSFIEVLTILQGIGVETVQLYYDTVPLIVTAIIYGLGYMGLRQSEIFSPAEDLGAGKKYEKSPLTQAAGREYKERLLGYMESEKPYLDSDLTLPALADRVGIPAYQLSQVINESLGVSFFDFVNGYRVEEAKRLLQDSSKSAYTILAIAEEAGFNSKSAFNAIFKRVVRQTPSEFRKNRVKSEVTSQAGD
jgi:AraC-like DNA-binding protein